MTQEKILKRRRYEAGNVTLRDSRLMRGYTLAQLHELTGISISALSRMEAGTRGINKNVACKLALALHIEPATLMGLPTLSELV
jgi:transcriptional regulator with XRE-family HTH domain